MQLEPPGLDVGQFEDVIDQLQQAPAAGMDGFREFAAFRLRQLWRGPDDLGEPDDGVQRCAQLVRHVGEEFRLHPIGFLQLEVGTPQHFDGLSFALEPPRVVERDRGLVGQDLQHLHQRGVEGADIVEIDRDGADELAFEEHRQPQRRPPAIALGQGIEREAAVELDILREDRALFDHDLGHEPRRDVRERFAVDIGVDALPHFDHLFCRGGALGQRDQAGRGVGDADHRARHPLEERGRTHRRRGQRLGNLPKHFHRGIEPERLLPGLLEEERVLERDGDLRPQGSRQLDVVIPAEGAVPFVGQQEHADRPAAGTQRHQQQVAIPEGLGQQLPGLDVVQAVLDDGGLLGDEHATDQGRGVGAKAQLVQAHLVEEPALPHARGSGRRDQCLEAFLVEEKAAHLDVE